MVPGIFCKIEETSLSQGVWRELGAGVLADWQMMMRQGRDVPLVEDAQATIGTNGIYIAVDSGSDPPRTLLFRADAPLSPEWVANVRRRKHLRLAVAPESFDFTSRWADDIAQFIVEVDLAIFRDEIRIASVPLAPA